MLFAPGWRRWFNALLNPEVSPEIERLLATQTNTVPVFWLLGKTGSGKTSIIQRLTGDSKAQIGNGFEPCTTSANRYNHPHTAPVMQFLDTRGLGESEYDPAEDLEHCEQTSHVVVIVTRVDDLSQAAITDALKKMTTLTTQTPILQVHTALHSVDSQALTNAIKHNQQQIKSALGFNIAQVNIDFTKQEDGFDDPDQGLAELQKALINLVPALAKLMSKPSTGSAETELFSVHRRQVIGFASASAAADVVPAVGLIAVPSIQGKMLHTLAGRYGLTWDKNLIVEFIAALGAGFIYRYAVSLISREAAKFIPVYGQSVGAAAAASISFASTYALGRAACLYFYRRSTLQTVNSEELRTAFTDAFNEEK